MFFVWYNTHFRNISVHVSVLNVTPHQIGHQTAEGVKASAHICRKGIQIVPHR